MFDFQKKTKSLGEQIAAANEKNFFVVSKRNESTPKYAMFLAHLLSIAAFLGGVYYLPIGLIWKGIALLIGTVFMVQWERGRSQFLIDYHKGQTVLGDKKPTPEVLAAAEELIDVSRDAKVWVVIFTIGDLFTTLGMWIYTAYFDAMSMKTAAIAAKGKVAATHLATVGEAVKGGYSSKTLSAIGAAASKADAAIQTNYTGIIITAVCAALAILLIQAFTYATSQWFVSSVYQNQKKKFGQRTTNRTTPNEQPTAQLPTANPNIRRAG